jgi:hypothetical protein
VAYEPQYQSFRACGLGGQAKNVVFKKAGRLATGYQPELYFFEVDGSPVVVGVSGAALDEWQRFRRYLSREQKIDIAGLFLKQQVEAGEELVAEKLFIQGPQLEELIRALGLSG